MRKLLTSLLLATLTSFAAIAQPPDPPAPPEEAAEENAVAAEEALREEVQESTRALRELAEEAEAQTREIIEENRDRVDVERSTAIERRREIREIVRRRYRDASRRSDSKVYFGSTIRVDEGEVGSDLVAIGGSIYVDGDCYGDVVAVGGSVHVDGAVTGDVVAVGGEVVLGENAEVLGEVTSVGGRVKRAEGAEVYGSINEVSLGQGLTLNLSPWKWNMPERRDRSWFRFGNAMELAWTISRLILLVILCLLIYLFGSRTIEQVRDRIASSFWVAGLVGLAVQIFFFPVLVIVCLILVVSIIGIPLLLLIPFALLGFLIVLLAGYTASALGVGRWVSHRMGWSTTGAYAALLVGILCIQAAGLVGDALEVVGGLLTPFAVMFTLVGALIKYGAWTFGLGAVALQAFDARSGRRSTLPPLPSGGPTEPTPSGDRGSGIVLDDEAIVLDDEAIVLEDEAGDRDYPLGPDAPLDAEDDPDRS